MDDISRIYSWFWGEGEYYIPTSGYSNIILSNVATLIEMRYGKAIKLLKEEEEARQFYKGIREAHRIQIAEKIKEIRTFASIERYVSLITQKPWILKKHPKSDIASYLNISIGTLEKFSSINA